MDAPSPLTPFERLAYFLETRPVKKLNLLQPNHQTQEAAVLVLLFQNQQETCLVLNKRSESVDHHKGQICFPGGVYDASDMNLWQTALRETNEEMGIHSHQVKYLGRLGEVITPTNFRISPFVGELLSPYEWKINSTEIEKIFSVPISHLLDPANFKMETNLFFGVEFPDPRFKYQNHEIWGATGRIIMDLLECWKVIFHTTFSPSNR